MPRGPSEGGGSLIGQTSRGGLERAQGGRRCAANSWKGLLKKTPEPDHLEERLTVPMCDKGQEIPQVR